MGTAVEKNILTGLKDLSARLNGDWMNNGELVAKSYLNSIDKLEVAMVTNFPQVKCKLTHTFTPGLYSRKVEMRAGMLISSKIHKSEHQYVVAKGKVMVWIGNEKGQLLEAGYNGITYPGTHRRVLVHEDAVWITFHATTRTTVEEVEKDIMEQRKNLLLNQLLSKEKIQLCHL